ncbi:MAG: hypothetical protein D6696_02585 [Acidobacteria bacterium]|nr:MAG: hypothetical protein D6696_02585 [Acidobacteriota bacterium]
MVDYLSPEEREAYRLDVKNGKLYDSEGGLFDTRDATSVHSNEPRAIFVMAPDGSIYVSKQQRIHRFHHSSLVAGDSVAAAGEIEVEDGILRLVSNKSGHYRPLAEHADQLLELLAEQGVEVRGVTKDYV